MVRTRSGKSTNPEDNVGRQETPKRASQRKRRKSRVNEPGAFDALKSTLQGPHTFGWWCYMCSHSFGLIIALFGIISCFLSTTAPSSFAVYFCVSVLVLRMFDSTLNTYNECLTESESEHLNIGVLCTEVAINTVECSMLFLICGESSTAMFAASVVTGITVLACNIKFRDYDSMLGRAFTYIIFAACVVLYQEQVASNDRLILYFLIIAICSVMDTADFPDRFFSGLTVCESWLGLLRSIAVYMLTTGYLLNAKGEPMTYVENTIYNWISSLIG